MRPHSAVLFQLSYYKQASFLRSVSATFCFAFYIFGLFVGDFAVCNGPKHSALVPSSVPKCKESGLCLTEKIHVMDKLCSGMSYSGIDHEFSVNESAMYIK